MKKIKFLSSAKKEVVTTLTVHKDHLEYHCPECGQIVKHGINGKKGVSVTYPKGTTEEQKLNHTHIYPTYIDVEYFASRGLEIPAITFRQKMKNFTKSVIKGIKGDK